MSELAKDWGWSTNEEHWGGGAFGFASREEAERAGAEEIGEPGAPFWTGCKADVLELVQVSAQDVLEQIGQEVYEAAGEHAEGWPGDLGVREEALSAKFTELARAYLEEHDAPGFFAVVETEKHTVPAEDWGWSDDEEHWPGEGEFGFASREEAVAAARAAIEPDRGFWPRHATHVGVRRFRIKNPSWIFEDLGEQAYEELDESGSGWPSSPGAEAEKELLAGLNKVLHEWLEKHDPPGFRAIEKVEWHAAIEAEAAS